jgi:hypothetical protein
LICSQHLRLKYCSLLAHQYLFQLSLHFRPHLFCLQLSKCQVQKWSWWGSALWPCFVAQNLGKIFIKFEQFLARLGQMILTIFSIWDQGLPDGLFTNQNPFGLFLKASLYNLVKFTTIWYILWSFDIFYGHWVHMYFCGHLCRFTCSRFGMLYREKSGNPDWDHEQSVPR